MRRKMTKCLLGLLMVLLVAMLMGCAPSKCEMCGMEKGKLQKYTVAGETVWLCQDCDEVAEFMNAFGF